MFLSTPHTSLSCLLLASMLALGACAGVEDDSSKSPLSDSIQPIEVIPEFTLKGTDQMPERLFLTDLGFTISEIRLTPVSEDLGRPAYSVPSQDLTFDVARGQTVRHGESIVLPEAGQYLVSLRLEPVSTTNEEGVVTVSSFTMSGFVFDDGSYEVQRSMGGVSEDPQPGFFGDDEAMTDAEDSPESWTPIVYHSQRSVFMHLNNVTFEPGSQYLTLEFDARRWAAGLIEPLTRAVSKSRQSSEIGDDHVDVSLQLDARGFDPSGFIDNGFAHTMRRE